MPKYTKLLQFDGKTRLKIKDRDKDCYFCQMGYHMESASLFDYQIWDIMHVVPKSSLGLGIVENGVLGCRYHHSLMDNGNKGLRTEMIGILENYLQSLYPGWARESVIYRKHKFSL